MGPALLLVAAISGILLAESPEISAIGSAARDSLFGDTPMWLAVATMAIVVGALLAGPLRIPFHRDHLGISVDDSHPDLRPVVRAIATLFAIASVFVGMGARMHRLVEAADRDRAVAWRALSSERPATSAIRRVDARVAGRRESRHRIEILLDDVVSVDAGGEVPVRIRLRLMPDDGTSRAGRVLWPGRRARLALRFSPLLHARNPGTSDRERNARRHGLGVQGRLVGPDWVIPWRVRRTAFAKGMGRATEIRARARDRIRDGFDEIGGDHGLARALALGDRRGLSDDTLEAFAKLGLSHLIAISGLHVGMIGLAVAWSVRRGWGYARGGTGTRSEVYGPPFLAAAAFAWLYGWVSGAGPAVQRSALALSFFGAARWLGYDLSARRALVWAALGLLIVDPAMLFDLGAQLSFAACAGLVWVGDGRDELDRAPKGLEAIRRNLASAFRVSLAASLATAPWAASAGLVLSPYGPFVNLVAIPATAMVALPSSLSASLSMLVGASAPARVLLWPTRMLEAGATVLAEQLPDPTVLAAGVVGWEFMLVAATGLVSARLGRLRVASLVWLGLCLLGAGPLSDQMSDHDGAISRVVFFDVGQGDAALIQRSGGANETGTAILVDAGFGSVEATAPTSVVRALRAMGVTALDALAVTHGDADHAGGVDSVLAQLPVGALWLPNGARGDPRLRRLEEVANKRGVGVRWLSEGEGLQFGDGPKSGVGVEVVWPPKHVGSSALGWNDRSLALRVEIEGRRFLLAADLGSAAEEKLLEGAAELSADVLKVGHHGSRRGTTPDFLRAVAADFVVVSAPCLPSRGLPHPRILDRLEEQGAEVLWTGRDGMVTLEVARLGRVIERPAMTGPGLVARRWAARRPCGLGSSHRSARFRSGDGPPPTGP